LRDIAAAALIAEHFHDFAAGAAEQGVFATADFNHIPGLGWRAVAAPLPHARAVGRCAAGNVNTASRGVRGDGAAGQQSASWAAVTTDGRTDDRRSLPLAGEILAEAPLLVRTQVAAPKDDVGAVRTIGAFEVKTGPTHGMHDAHEAAADSLYSPPLARAVSPCALDDLAVAGPVTKGVHHTARTARQNGDFAAPEIDEFPLLIGMVQTAALLDVACVTATTGHFNAAPAVLRGDRAGIDNRSAWAIEGGNRRMRGLETARSAEVDELPALHGVAAAAPLPDIGSGQTASAFGF
jgi:hypothetical protein